MTNYEIFFFILRKKCIFASSNLLKFNLMKHVKLNENVSVKSHKHNCDIVKNPQKFFLKVIIEDINFPNCYRITSPFLNDKALTRYQIFHFFIDFLSHRSLVSFSKSFFSPFNSNKFYMKYKANLDYFKSKFNYFIDLNYIPCLLEAPYKSSYIYYFIAVPI